MRIRAHTDSGERPSVHAIDETLRSRGAHIANVDPRCLGTQTLDDLVRASRRGFGKDISRQEVIDHVMDAQMLQLVFSGGRVVGFAAYAVHSMQIQNGGPSPMNVNVLFLGGTVLDSDVQGRGITALAISRAMEETNLGSLSFRTQNPAMYSTAMKVPGLNLYPSTSDGEVPRPEAVHIGKEMAMILNEQHYQELNFTDEGTYGRELNGFIPRVSEEAEKLFARLRIKRENGDSVIVVGLRD